MDSATGSSWTERRRSLRWRVAAALAALSLCAILAQSLAWLWLLERQEDAFINQQLNEQIVHSMALSRDHPEAAFPNSPSMWLYREPLQGGGQRVPPPPQFAPLAVGDHEVFIGSHEYHVLVRADDAARYILVYEVEDHEFRLSRLFWATLLAAFLLAALTLGSGYWLAGRLTRHLAGLAAAVGREAPGPLAEPAMEREVQALAVAIDDYRARQQETIAREQAFAANLSHELRTPLTTIRTDAELLAALPDMPDSARRRAARILDSVDRISELAASLLLLAREARSGRREALPLAAVVTALWTTCREARSPLPPTGLRNMIPEAARVRADPVLFELILRNILDNALRYSEAGEVHCWLEDGCLCIRDSGPGFAPEELAHVFDRFYIGRRGQHGLGLALVQHACAACGWQVSAANAPEGGALIRLHLAAGDLTIPSHAAD